MGKKMAEKLNISKSMNDWKIDAIMSLKSWTFWYLNVFSSSRFVGEEASQKTEEK